MSELTARHGPLSHARYLSGSNPSSYAGMSVVRRYSKPKASSAKVEHFLGSMDTYGLHKEPKPPKKNSLFVHKLRQLIEVDLVDKILDEGSNSHWKHWLVCIDAFSRFVWLRLLKTKAAEEVAIAMSSILESMSLNGVPERCLSDRGSEFRSRKYRDLMKEHNIAQSWALFHAPHVERVQVRIERERGGIRHKKWH